MPSHLKFSTLLFPAVYNKCIVIDWPLTTIIMVFRSITDFIYLMHMLVQFKLAFIPPESGVVGVGKLVDDPKKVALHYLSGFFPLDLFIVIPLLRFLPLLAGQSLTGFIFESAWANFVINLLTFVLAGHVVGSCCFENCKKLIDCGHGSEFGSLAENPEWNKWKENNNSAACFIKDGDFHYGIYAEAVNFTAENSFTPDKSTNVINQKEVSDAAEVRSNSKSDGGNSRILEKVENIDGCFSSEGRNIGVKPKEGGSILEILDKMIKVGQTMGFSMEGCTKDMENIIGSKGVEALGNSGGILCTWDSSIFHKEHHIISDNFVALYGTWIPNQLKLLCLVMGDFNEVRCKEERWGSTFNAYGANVFNIFISSSGLIDVQLEGPILLMEYISDFGAIPFRFNHSWFGLPGFDQMVIDSWNSLVLDDNNALIPKILDPKIVSDYRPISLIGSLYKVITKILPTRLFSVISSLISDVQSAFLPNRQILDGPFILSELLSWCKFKYNQSMVFKVDFAKAYDSIRWDYLDDVLNYFGFGSKWRSWIRGSLISGKASILVNGSPTSEFQFHRGLKQGDPLAPFLFILIMESLHLFFSRAVEEGIITGIEIGSSLTISHLFYVDDAVFIGEWSHNNLKGLGYESIVMLKRRLSRGNFKTLSIGGRLNSLNRCLVPLQFITCRLQRSPNQCFIQWRVCVEISSTWDDIQEGDKKMAWGSFVQYGVALYIKIILYGAWVISGIYHVRLHRCISESFSSLWKSILNEVKSLKAQGVDLISHCKIRDLNGDGVFRVKDVRNLLDETFLPKADTPTRWIKCIPVKVNVFVWKALQDRLPTRSNLVRRNILIDSLSCLICDGELEDSSHLFFRCCLARDVTRLVCRWWDLDFHSFNSYTDWQGWFKQLRLGAKSKEVLEGVFYVSWWSLWNFRNHLLFADSNPRKDAIFDEIVLRSFNWCLARELSSRSQTQISRIAPRNRYSPSPDDKSMVVVLV
ncbi:RNA-directed DNA polymerase, eukaryota [Tanacetum coccineum]